MALVVVHRRLTCPGPSWRHRAERRNGLPGQATAPASRDCRRASSSPCAVRMITGTRESAAARCLRRSPGTP